MSQVVVYKRDDGTVSVIYPTTAGLARLGGIHAIAARDVPAGKPYKVIDPVLLPATREDRDLWTIADSELIDGVGT